MAAAVGVAAAAAAPAHDSLSQVLDRLCTATTQRLGGQSIAPVDDVRLTAFVDAHRGLDFAIEMQRAASGAHNRLGGGDRLVPRIGIAAGRPGVADPLPLAVAVCDMAGAGSILLTQDTVDALLPRLEVGLFYMAELMLPGQSRAVRVYRVSTDPADAGRIVTTRVDLWDEQGGAS